MRTSLRAALLGLALIVFAGDRDLAAQGFLNPFIGATLTSPSPLGGRSRTGFGVAFGSIGMIFGGDFEIAYFPEVIDQTNGVAGSRAITFAGNTLIGPRIHNVKIYGAFGAGDTILSATPLAALTDPSIENLSSHYFTLNTGGGVIAFFGHHLGMRGDIRYSRAYGVTFSDLQGSNAAFNHFNFWRGTLGLAVKF
jgi:hypothetical protein